MLIQTGTLSSVTGAAFGSGVSTSPIYLAGIDWNTSDCYLWASIEGDSGRTGGSVAVFWKGSYQKSGVTYAMENNVFLIKSGTSVSGTLLNGSYLKKFSPVMPFIQIEAVLSKSGSTQHGSGTTNTQLVRWALIAA